MTDSECRFGSALVIVRFRHRSDSELALLDSSPLDQWQDKGFRETTPAGGTAAPGPYESYADPTLDPLGAGVGVT